ncbi:hypothetical protein GCM10007416_15650 [Kroppenstedtia guangzhouensis]|uniref:YhfS-like C-terminal domain-containing protein n=1 Tax=Kroppenstedtia guangzhouensis TaxID=1274356 RepID=A0ABQ1GGK5_9BACL|nr:aminotransferase class V-fold PLP-dependent enzyme [Kroppenstedtia guangzhouensis]GGA43442.1 hypothetical protein GCM10007416_15650 [Kroppenstedtia guangzhouensis]
MGPANLNTMTVNEAKEMQFRLTEAIASTFRGNEFLNLGDLGVVPGKGRPLQTEKVEEVLARFFGVEACALVRGAGTGAIRTILAVLTEPGDPLMVHTSPMYQTTKETVRLMGLIPKVVDYNNSEALRNALKEQRDCKVFYVQHSRQHPEDTYDLDSVIQLVRSYRPDLPIVVDDNYTALKVPKIGVELGASFSCFSGFKLLGPPGIGIVVGKKEPIDTLKKRNYSGGGQVQGFEAMELLRSLVMAPVAIAVQTEQVDFLCRGLNNGEVPLVAKAYITFSQSKNVILELEEPIAPQVIAASEKYGAAIYPVGAESRYEVLPMIYRPSGTFLESRPQLAQTGIRLNPMRAGAELTMEILRKAIADVTGERV